MFSAKTIRLKFKRRQKTEEVTASLIVYGVRHFQGFSRWFFCIFQWVRCSHSGFLLFSGKLAITLVVTLSILRLQYNGDVEPESPRIVGIKWSKTIKVVSELINVNSDGLRWVLFIFFYYYFFPPPLLLLFLSVFFFGFLLCWACCLIYSLRPAGHANMRSGSTNLFRSDCCFFLFVLFGAFIHFLWSARICGRPKANERTLDVRVIASIHDSVSAVCFLSTFNSL